MREILIVKTSSMGDVIQYLPAVTDLLARVPSLAIDWVVEAPFAPLVRLHPGVRQVIPVALRSWRKRLWAPATWRAFGGFRREVRKARYERVIDAQGLLKSALLARMAGAPVAGYMPDSAREPFATRFYDDKYRVSWQMHAVERNRRLTAAVFDYPLDLPLDYGIRAPAPLADAWRVDGAYAVLLTATSRDEKLWPEPNWVELGRALNRRGLHCVLAAGNDTERARAGRIAANLPHASLAPPMALDALAGLIDRAQCVVGVDTGLSHLAAALKVPVVALYIATEPGANGVAGGANAVNLGGRGQCPSVASVLQALGPWVA
ncbi:lipopolysaccharide heptosyltransferase I [Niveibacterium sp. 24ML]|uniref:lipopolysaccharide heptosyltransferase I n=1 Tax=Niveibacterium sp. 24ML TaxID=2985512 RepID=UPI002270C3CD|nr:lipopolysaccharide heptosyltransferase I [Niveibacterium sp. 24ML]MCX9154546.1 lipopolysaccharide heptosyltransferase I [Niveibacterium sp. 24ML]